VGRYFEGAGEDVYRFQELNSDDENIGVSLDHGLQQAPNGRQLHNPDDLYFNDMDIRAWERRASALEGSPYDLRHGMQEESEGYYDEAGEAVSRVEYEELLFSRVLDKIRVARAAGNPDVQLSPEELEAYQSRLYGSRSPAISSQPKSRSNASPIMDDAASVLSGSTSRPGHSSSSKSKSKKTGERTSLFSSKPKKEKPSERKRTVSNVSSGSSQISPGFVIPGPDGQRIYTPINAYQGSLARDPDPQSQPSSHSASGSSQTYHGYARSTAPSEIGKAVPGAFSVISATPAAPYRPASPPRQGRPTTQQPTQERSGSRIRSPSIQSANFVPFPIEPYQYHSFSPSSASSQPSPQLQYTRSASEASYTSMPRRVPVPTQPAAPAASSYDASPIRASYQGIDVLDSGVHQSATTTEVVPEPVLVQPAKASGIGRDGERRRKGGKSKKRT
jgi:hypothetical protein